MEEQRHLEDGSQVRPNVQARVLLQLGDPSGSLRDTGPGGLTVVRRQDRGPVTPTNTIGLIVHLIAPHGEENAGQSSREGDHGYPVATTTRNRSRPGAYAGRPRVSRSHHAPCRLNEERLHLRMRTAKHATAVLAFAGAVLPWHEPEGAGHLRGAFESRRVVQCGDKGTGRDWSDSGHRHEAGGDRIIRDQRGKPLVGSGQFLIQYLDRAPEGYRRHVHRLGQLERTESIKKYFGPTAANAQATRTGDRSRQ